MRFLLFLSLIFFFSSSAFSQQTYEFGLRATGINNVGLLLKKERSVTKFTRYRLGFGNLRFAASRGTNLGSVSVAGAVGWEKRRRLADRTTLLHGWEPFASMAFTASGNGSAVALTGGVGYVIGLQYALSDRFHLALEMTPALTVGLNDVGGGTLFTLDAEFNSNSFALTGVYRFLVE